MSSGSANQQQPPGMSSAIGSSQESNRSRIICHLRAITLGHVADYSAGPNLNFTLKSLTSPKIMFATKRLYYALRSCFLKETLRFSGPLAKLLSTRNQCGRSGFDSRVGQIEHSVGRKRLAIATTFLRSCVVPAVAVEMDPPPVTRFGVIMRVYPRFFFAFEVCAI